MCESSEGRTSDSHLVGTTIRCSVRVSNGCHGRHTERSGNTYARNVGWRTQKFRSSRALRWDRVSNALPNRIRVQRLENMQTSDAQDRFTTRRLENRPASSEWAYVASLSKF